MRRVAEGALASCVLVWVAACADLGERRADDRRELERVTSERLGLADFAPGPELGRAEPRPESLELLAEGLDEEEAVRLSLLENRAVRAAFEELGVASADVIQAGLVANPIFSGNAALFDSGSEIRLGLSQPLFDLLWRSLRVDLAEAELEAARARVAARLVALAFDVRRAFARAQAAEAHVCLESDALLAARASEELMRTLHEAGNVVDAARTREGVGLERAELDLAESRLEALERREELLVLLGLASDPGFVLVGDFAATREAARRVPGPAELLELEERALGASLELLELEALARGEARRAGLSSTGATMLAQGQLGIVAQRELSSSEWGLGPSLTLGIPLFEDGSAGRAAAASRLAAVVARREARERALRSAARRLGARLASLEERARRARAELVRLRARFVLESLQQYNAMQIGVFEVLEARRAELSATREALLLEERACLARLELERLEAGVLGEHALEEGEERTARSLTRRGH